MEGKANNLLYMWNDVHITQPAKCQRKINHRASSDLWNDMIDWWRTPMQLMQNSTVGSLDWYAIKVTSACYQDPEKMPIIVLAMKTYDNFLISTCHLQIRKNNMLHKPAGFNQWKMIIVRLLYYILHLQFQSHKINNNNTTSCLQNSIWIFFLSTLPSIK